VVPVHQRKLKKVRRLCVFCAASKEATSFHFFLKPRTCNIRLAEIFFLSARRICRTPRKQHCPSSELHSVPVALAIRKIYAKNGSAHYGSDWRYICCRFFCCCCTVFLLPRGRHALFDCWENPKTENTVVGYFEMISEFWGGIIRNLNQNRHIGLHIGYMYRIGLCALWTICYYNKALMGIKIQTVPLPKTQSIC
jgi:hypothetical protein